MKKIWGIFYDKMLSVDNNEFIKSNAVTFWYNKTTYYILNQR